MTTPRRSRPAAAASCVLALVAFVLLSATPSAVDCSPVFAPNPQLQSAAEVTNLMGQWTSIAKVGPANAGKLAALYTEDATLAAFDEPVPMSSRSALEDYFATTFLPLKPMLTWSGAANINCQLHPNVCTRSGTISLRVQVPTGYNQYTPVVHAARATVVYVLNETALPARTWLIAEMHLSKEKAKAPK